MARPRPLSGFPELLPADRIIEQHVLDSLRRVFELHGFVGIETRAVEPLAELLRKGETSKEVYLLRRLQEEETAAVDDERQLALHFDLTVPFARYVLENSGHLHFPFRRYQIQKVWRGERPQDGRFREFVQADIDVVGAGDLPFHTEVELALVMAAALASLREIGVPPARILVNNRKLSEGFYRGLGLPDVDGVLRAIDKLDKVGPQTVAEMLVDGGTTAEQAQACLALAQVSGDDGAAVAAQVRSLAARHGVVSELLEEGLGELTALLDAARAAGSSAISADLKIARGLDYYTGTVYETVLEGHEDLGSICSGGRYDALAADGDDVYPGVGLSIGVSRLVSRLVGRRLVTATRSVPSAVVVAVTSEDTRAASDAVAARLRARGVPCEVAPTAAKFGKQIRYADRRGVPFVWFPGAGSALVGGGAPAGDAPPVGAAGDQVKDIRTGEQVDADPATWEPPAEDWWPRVVPADGA